jgi:hypothetical protein
MLVTGVRWSLKDTTEFGELSHHYLLFLFSSHPKQLELGLLA